MKLRNIVVATMLCLLSVAVLAQRETGTLSGTVTDSTGAVISTGKITVRSTTTGAVRTASKNGSGLYSAPDLQPGTYDVTIEAPGFAMQALDKKSFGNSAKLRPRACRGS